jgi:O-6-methylguanine DNA methyltransferase
MTAVSLRVGRLESSIGTRWVAESDRGVFAVADGDLDRFLAALRRRLPEVEPVEAAIDGSWIDAVLETGALPPVDLRGLSKFDRRVYEVVRTVKPGETVTYGEVAARLGSPRGARAVGRAMARCPLFPAVPCHRVVRASDGWSGWGADPTIKRRLLAAERR